MEKLEGNVKEVLDKIDGIDVEEASTLLEHEKSEDGKHRKSVINALESIIEDDDDDAADVETVKMVRDGKTADVHPDEVANWNKHGWNEAE